MLLSSSELTSCMWFLLIKIFIYIRKGVFKQKASSPCSVLGSLLCLCSVLSQGSDTIIPPLVATKQLAGHLEAVQL